MFQKDEQSIASKDAETIIGQSVKVKGNFHGEGNIIIEGQVEGSVKTKNNLLIGNKASILADIEANDAKIGGTITGNINLSGYLEVKSTAKITGDISAKEISIEKGGIVNGLCKIGLEKNHAEKSTTP